MDAHDARLLALLQARGPALHALLTRLTLRADVAEDLMQELFLRLRRSAAFPRAGDPGGHATRAAFTSPSTGDVPPRVGPPRGRPIPSRRPTPRRPSMR